MTRHNDFIKGNHNHFLYFVCMKRSANCPLTTETWLLFGINNLGFNIWLLVFLYNRLQRPIHFMLHWKSVHSLASHQFLLNTANHSLSHYFHCLSFPSSLSLIFRHLNHTHLTPKPHISNPLAKSFKIIQAKCKINGFLKARV